MPRGVPAWRTARKLLHCCTRSAAKAGLEENASASSRSVTSVGATRRSIISCSTRHHCSRARSSPEEAVEMCAGRWPWIRCGRGHGDARLMRDACPRQPAGAWDAVCERAAGPQC